MICELLGVPYSERDEFQTRAVRQMDVTLSAEERIELSRDSPLSPWAGLGDGVVEAKRLGPLTDINNVRRIHSVVHRGRYLSPIERTRLLTAAEVAAQHDPPDQRMTPAKPWCCA
jgi:hypothetical protein